MDEINDKNPTNLTMEISSPGGYLYEGTALYSFLDEKQKNGMNFTSKAVGLAASAATFPFVAAPPENRLFSAASEIMIHDALTGLFEFGNREKIKKSYENTMDGLDRATNKIVEIYVNTTNNSEATIKSMLSKNTYMTSLFFK